MNDPYEVLGLSPDASPAEIRSRHRELARQLHPDRFAQCSEATKQSAEERMAEVNAGDRRWWHRLRYWFR